MLSNWRLIAINDDSSAVGIFSIYSESVKLTITDGSVTKSVFGSQICNQPILGVVFLTEDSVMAQCFTKLQLEVLNCFKDIRKFQMKYSFSSYVGMAYEVCLRRSIPDIIADSFANPTENCILEGNKVAIIGREIGTYRYEFIIKDRKKFDKVISKYIIMRGRV